MDKDVWARKLENYAKGADSSPLLDPNSQHFWTTAETFRQAGSSPEDCFIKMRRKADLLDDYLAKNLSPNSTINDSTRSTRDVVGRDSVNRDLHGPSVEELAEMLGVNMEDLD